MILVARFLSMIAHWVTPAKHAVVFQSLDFGRTKDSGLINALSQSPAPRTSLSGQR